MPGILIPPRNTGQNPRHSDPLRTELLPREARVLLKEMELLGMVGAGVVNARWDMSYVLEHPNATTNVYGSASLDYRGGDDTWGISAARGSKTKRYKKPETAIKHFRAWLKKGCLFGPIK